MEILLIIGLLLVVIAFIAYLTDNEGIVLCFGMTGAYIVSGAVFMIQESKKPTAMDVYQGKTTLEITYKDGVPVDSVVVFKDKRGE